MPEITSGRITVGTGEINFTGSGGSSTNNPAPPVQKYVQTVKGENIGDGIGLYLGSNGVENVVLDFKTVQVGDGLEIVDGVDSILLRYVGPGSDGATTFRGLSDTPNTIVPNAVLVGATSTSMLFTPAASVSGSVLMWNGSAFTWYVPTTGTVTSIGISGQNGISVIGSSITTSGTFTIGLNNTGVVAGTYEAATIVVDSRGRISSAVSNQQGFINNGANVGTGLGNVYASKSGSVMNLRTIKGLGSINVTTSGNDVLIASSAVNSVAALGQNGIQVTGGPITNTGTLNIGLTLTGVSFGTYTNPSLVIDQYGRILSATTSTSQIGVNNNGSNVGSYNRLDFTGDVSVTNSGGGVAIVSIPGSPIKSISNLGSSSNAGQIFETVTGTQARLRRIVGTGGITINQNATDVIIDGSTIEGNAVLTAESVGTTGGNLLFGVADRTIRLRRIRSPQNTLLISTSTNHVDIDLATSGVIPGTYNQVVVDARGRVINGSESGVVTEVTVVPGPGLAVFNGSITSSGTVTIGMAATGVSAGTYVNPALVVDSLGRITNISGGNNGAVSAVGIQAGTGITVSGASTVTTTGTFTIGMSATGVAAGTYTNTNLVVDSVGRILSAANGASAITRVVINSGTGINVVGGPITSDGTFTIGMAISGVTPGTYTNPSITIDATGRITAASTGSGGGGGGVSSVNLTPGPGITVSGGPITTSGNILVGLAPSGVTPGTYSNSTFIVDGTGRIISATPSGMGGGVGTVTSVGLSPGTGLSVTGSPITTSGTFSIGLTSSGVNPGTYVSATIVVDNMGRVTQASNGSGSALTTGSYDIATVIVDAQGRISNVTSLTPSNLGTGSQVLIAGVPQLRFRTLKAGSNITLSQSSTEITIAASNNGITVENLGGTLVNSAFIYDESSPEGNLRFRKISGDTNILVTQDTNDIDISLQNTGVSPGTYTNATVVLDTKGRVLSATSGSGGGGGGSYAGPQNYAFRINFDGSGNLAATTTFQGVPPGWTATRDSNTQFTITYAVPSGEQPFPMSPTFYGHRVGSGYTVKFANGNPPTQFGISVFEDFTGFSVYGINATVLNSEPSGHAWVKLFI